MMIRIAFALLLFTLPLAAEEPAAVKTMTGHVFRPAKREPTPERVQGLKVPPGFSVAPFAQGLKAPRMMAVAPNGDVYVTRRDPENDVLLLHDADSDGKADGDPIKVASIPDVHGIAIQDGKIYLAAVRKLYGANIRRDGTLDEPKEIFSDLPDAGQHPNRTLAFSPKGELFLSVGSTCNAAPEPNPENATMLRVAKDGSHRTIFASGLRNTIGFDWSPKTGELWGMDHGIDWLGDDAQREELNLIREGKKYGWPFVYEDGKHNPADDPKEKVGVTWDEYARQCEPSVLSYTAHAAPMDLQFCAPGQFPEAYQGDAFVTFHGSWNRGEASGYKVMRLKFDQAGKPEGFEDFLTGFMLENDKAQFGRPCGLAFDKTGALLVSDDGGGMIYRVSFAGPHASQASR